MSLQPIQTMHLITNRNYWWEYRAELCYMWTLFKAVFGGHLYQPQGKVMFSQASVILSSIGLMATRSPLILLERFLVKPFFTGPENGMPSPTSLYLDQILDQQRICLLQSQILGNEKFRILDRMTLITVSSLWNSGPRYRKFIFLMEKGLTTYIIQRR